MIASIKEELASERLGFRHCDMCGSTFYPTSNRQKYCVGCKLIVRGEWNRANSAKVRSSHPEETRATQRRTIEKDPVRYASMRSIWSHNYITKVKQAVFSNYSSGSLVCSCCGESEFDLLTLDHVNNDGAKERPELYGTRKFGGTSFYRVLVRRGFPPGYAVLCMNCNMSKAKHGVCIHQLKRFERLGGFCHF